MLSAEDRGEARRNGIDISRYRDTITTSDIEKAMDIIIILVIQKCLEILQLLMKL